MQGHPRHTGHGIEFWQNVLYWRREWQTTSVFLPWELLEQYEKAKWYDTGRWTPQVSRCPICYWRSVRNNSRKNEETEPQQKQDPVVDVTGDGSKVWGYKEKYCIRTCVLGPWSRQIGSGQAWDSKSKHRNFRNQLTKMDWNGWMNSDGHYIYYCGK